MNIILLLKQNIWRFLLSGIFFAVLSLVLFLMVEPKFKVQTDFLVIQNQAPTQDIYMLSRSNEYISNVMKESIYSELFINEAMATGVIEESLLPKNRQDRLKEWKKLIDVSKSFQGNVLMVEVRHDSQKEALQISRAIADVLAKKNQLFRSGAPEDVEIRILSGPIYEQTLSFAMIVLIMGNGFLFGVVLLFAEHFLRRRSTAALV